MRNLFILLLLLCVGLLPAQANEKPSLIIGGDNDYPPYEYIDENNQPAGYNVELSRLIAEELGLKPVFRLNKWARVKEELSSGKIDLIQGMAFSIERAKTQHFSNPHMRTWRALFVRKNSSISSIDDALKAKILIQDGDIVEEYLKQIDFRGGLIKVPSQEDALELLANGTADAALVNYMHGVYLIDLEKLDNLKAIHGEILPKFYCMSSLDVDLISRIDMVLSKLQYDGRLDELQEKWFGKVAPELIRARRKITNLHIFHTLFFVVLFGVLIFWLLKWHKLNTKHKKLYTKYQAQKAEYKTLKEDYIVFQQGPLVAYKYSINPFKLKHISDGLREWGYEPSLALSRSEGYDDIVFSEDRHWVDLRIAEQLRENIQSDTKQYRIVTKSGEVRWVVDYNFVVYNDDENPVLYGYMVDITSQKNLEAELLEAKEKAETASIAKGHFLANMSHEIRTPLNGIMGFVQVLMQMDASPQQREYYDIIYSSGQNLMKIVSDILDVSKIESGKMDLIMTDFNPRFLIEDLVKTFSVQREKPSIDLRTKISDQIPTIVHGDMLRLRQIVTNLLQNAMKFTEEGFIEISAELYNFSHTDIRILFSVKDTGIGIDPMKQKDIFDNFSQLDNRVTRKYGGTGLGLAIVKRLVELMGGFIWVESKPGEGSRFYFIVPFKKQTDILLQSEDAAQTQIRNELLPPMHILLVEDELVNQSVTKKQLEQWNQTVTIAPNGEKAVEIYKVQNFDCILMDIQMPVMDGVTATQKIREFERKTGKRTIIYAYTACAMAGDRERFIEAGMDDYISKPVNLELLFSLLMKVKQ